MGFKTSISAEPLLDFDPRPLIKDLIPLVTESFWIGIMNYIPVKNFPAEDKNFYENARNQKKKKHLIELLNWTRNYAKIRYKNPIKKILNI